MGCGVGGPARNISRLAECHVTGINNNDYQIGRGNKINQRQGLAHRVSFVKGDFMHQPFEGIIQPACCSCETTTNFFSLFALACKNR